MCSLKTRQRSFWRFTATLHDSGGMYDSVKIMT